MQFMGSKYKPRQKEAILDFSAILVVSSAEGKQDHKPTPVESY
jgi:hypothetical protein